MENFIVSARKYRPITFASVVGQTHITSTLKNAIAHHHLAQAFLFCGPRGVGKTTCARILAKTINCQNITPTIEPCNQCESCISFQKNGSLNIQELDAASNNSVEDIRSLVDQVRYPPQAGKYKIYIIDEVHMLSNAAFNAFLKTLEEPPSYAIFILATTEKHKIIPTILSRCQIFDFNRIQISDISSHLAHIAVQEEIAAAPEALYLIAQKADGGLRDALSMFDLISNFSDNRSITYDNTLTHLHILDYDYYFKITEALLHENLADALLLFSDILKNGFDAHLFIVGLSEHLRNLIICKTPPTIVLLEVAEPIQQKYLQQAQAAPMSFLLSALNLANQCDLNYKNSKNPRLHVEISLMKIAHINAATQLITSFREEALKKKAEPIKNEASINPISTQKSQSSEKPSLLKTSIKIPDANNLPKAVTEAPAMDAITEQEKAAQKEISSQTIKEANREINKEEVEQAWVALTQSKQANITEFLILNRTFEWVDNSIIQLKLENSILLTNLESFKREWLAFLRDRLKIKQLDIQGEVLQQEDKKMIYTPKDKFLALADKHPTLKELQQRLGLDPDF